MGEKANEIMDSDGGGRCWIVRDSGRLVYGVVKMVGRWFIGRGN